MPAVESFGSALQGAAWAGNLCAVQMLVDKGANIDCSGGWFGSALSVARQTLKMKRRKRTVGFQNKGVNGET